MREKTHRHRAKYTVARPYARCVNPIGCNPAAHGDRVYIDRCRCGAQRRVNQNQGHAERGHWMEPDE